MPGALLAITRLSPPGSISNDMAHAIGEDGRRTYQVSPGRYRFVAHCNWRAGDPLPGQFRGRAEFDIEAGQTVDPHIITTLYEEWR